MQNITLDLLLSRKEQSEKDKLKVALYYSKALNGNIEIHKLKTREVIRILDNLDFKNFEETVMMNCKLIYKHCPIFKSKELQEAYDVAEPYDVVLEVFNDNIGEITKLSEKILSLYGIGNDDGIIIEEVENIKN